MFLSVDPDLGDEDDSVTMNGYTYADNNPVMMVDPDAHLAWSVPVAKLAVKQPLKYKYKKTVAG